MQTAEICGEQEPSKIGKVHFFKGQDVEKYRTHENKMVHLRPLLMSVASVDMREEERSVRNGRFPDGEKASTPGRAPSRPGVSPLAPPALPASDLPTTLSDSASSPISAHDVTHTDVPRILLHQPVSASIRELGGHIRTSEELLIVRHLSIFNLDPGSTPDSTTNKQELELQQDETHDLTVSPPSKWREEKDRFSLQDQLCNGQKKTGDRFSAPRADLILYNGHSLSDAVYKHQKILVSTITVFNFVSWSGLFVNLTEDTSEFILLQAFRCWQ
ncbi:hypothetical protein C8R44DRAFT_750905 [Mycena epipterygia]|nr:hypothetical protein C8R44DRAFT_750905 [Mycena epipterygia]